MEGTLNGTGAEHLEHLDALRWLHIYQSADFKMVRDLAGVGRVRQAMTSKKARVGQDALPRYTA